MARRKVKHREDWQKIRRPGWSGGMTEYRYGSRKPISLSRGLKKTRILQGDKRRHVINRMLDIMQDWRLTPFEGEGEARAALRANLCLAGYGWHRADLEAKRVTDECLRRMGAKRPSWEQGQPSYTVPRENCAWCRSPLTDSDELTGSRRFCSMHCAKMMKLSLEDRDSALTEKLYLDVNRIVLRSKRDRRKCDSCGKLFYPLQAQVHQRFCSHDCYAASLVAMPTCKCEGCGKEFRQQQSQHAGKYCSRKCYNLTRKGFNPKHVKTCQHCAASFVSYRKAAMFCSNACQAASRVARPRHQFDRRCAWCRGNFVAKSDRAQCCSGRCTLAYCRAKAGNLPRKITAPAFDFVFKVAA